MNRNLNGSIIQMQVSQVIFREDLYPRIEKSPETVQKYATNLSMLPPVEVNQKYELIDGWHRWTAHKKADAQTIQATVTETASDAELLELAIERNAKHGLQLSQEDKRDMARKIYVGTPLREQGAKKKRLAEILSVDITTVQKWLARIDKDNCEKREVEIFNLWLACYTQDEIAQSVGVTQDAVCRVLRETGSFRFCVKVGQLRQEFEDKPENERLDAVAEENHQNAEHATDFVPPLYNVWKQQEKTTGLNHPGNSEMRLVDNLFYLYTQPFDIVVDPFAGSGSTIDLCKKRLRRYWVSDRKPIVEREHEIRLHDMTTGLPPLARWQDVKLVYLDPPYWKQTEGEYSNDRTDLANMQLKQFTEALADIINAFRKKLRAGAVIALLLSPTQWCAPERRYTDHIADMIRAIKLPLDFRVQCPYESEQCTAQMVEWAKENRKLLVLSRELVIWRCE
jgi:hypothetical protein